MENRTNEQGYPQTYFTVSRKSEHSKSQHNQSGVEITPMMKASKSADQKNKAAKILVVEDNKLNQIVAKTLLESEGYAVDIAANGQEALALFNQGYAVILMDIHLPDISGIDVAKHIRSQEAGKRIPIIALTANDDSYEQKCLQAGMNGFLMKPLIVENVIKMLAKFIA